MISKINSAFLQIAKRAEQSDPVLLEKTFVDTGSLQPLLSAPSHQIVYGRRGTGKTHALIFTQRKAPKSDLTVFVDLRRIGSNGSIYANPSLPVTDRATRLLLDVMEAVHDELVTAALERSAGTEVLTNLDVLADQIAKVKVEGDVEVERGSQRAVRKARSEGMKAELSTSSLSLSGESTSSAELNAGEHDKFVYRGRRVPHVHFGAVARLLEKVIEGFGNPRLWILFDEWSVVPLELQPFLADMLRRSVFPVPRIVVKIAAIEQRSAFKVTLPTGDYLGFELGADINADIDLDDFMVFGNDRSASVSFFRQLLYSHVVAVSPELEIALPSWKEFVAGGFTQEAALEEVVRACEGVPRDIINILGVCAPKAGDGKVGIPLIREAARTWYQRDKENAVPAQGKDLLNWIIDRVIKNRRARAFLLERRAGSHELVESLIDVRVLHIMKRGISSNEQPGIRFDAYAIDYGCYVDLLATKEAPKFLFETDEGDDPTIEVPKEDYRSIRRAVLNIEEYTQRSN